MGDKIDILKIILDFLKGNKVLLLIVTALMGGGAVGHYIPPLMEAKPVEITVTVPKNNEAAGLKKEIIRLKKKVKKLQRWHGGE